MKTLFTILLSILILTLFITIASSIMLTLFLAGFENPMNTLFDMAQYAIPFFIVFSSLIYLLTTYKTK
ncbi:hypothetical protein SAMN05444412_11165 [Rhodonellum ikkaensis]|uniref:Uncharacterized protein n=1 Tax=Rhodonellum ikkaensis TaxID=336829 RepID=A0A1H3SDS2_9BACT|nr:hypothetical protein SAMN05444412_11165 [Rhodonellum ikkaensis]